MLIIKNGNLLEATENLICHQVNEYGTMAGGLALQIATIYPRVESEYSFYTKNHTTDELLGNYDITKINETQCIVNCFTQKDFNTQYDLIKKVFREIIKVFPNKSIAIPYKYGCGIANGNWEEVEKILLDIFVDKDIVIYRKENNNV